MCDELKTCTKCQEEKSVDNFYKAVREKSGISNQCKECERAYNKSSEGKLRYAKYSQTPKAKLANIKKNKKQQQAFPERVYARQALRRAIKKGDIIRQSHCSSCNQPECDVGKIEAHHHEYTLPYDVSWLCKGCHSIWHNLHENQGTGYRLKQLASL